VDGVSENEIAVEAQQPADDSAARPGVLPVRQITLLPERLESGGLARRVSGLVWEGLRNPVVIASVTAAAAVATEIGLRLLEQPARSTVLGRGARDTATGALGRTVRVTETWTMTRTVESHRPW
jgi:hypothetical protein